jgi:hypothetical protein
MTTSSKGRDVAAAQKEKLRREAEQKERRAKKLHDEEVRKVKQHLRDAAEPKRPPMPKAKRSSAN